MRYIFVFGIIIKLFAAVLFSSEYKESFFVPFVDIFVTLQENPWEHVYLNSLSIEFPYHSLMLYVYSIPYSVIHLLDINNFYLSNFLFKIPTLISDFIILILLRKLFPGKDKEILIFYFLSPIVIYSCYLHSQLDLFPIMLLFSSIFFLQKKNISISSLLLGLAFATKLNVLVVFPLILLYLYRNFKVEEIFKYIVISFFIYFIINSPFIFSDGFKNLVLMNEQQSLLFSLSLAFNEEVRLFVTLFFLSVLYIRFASYKKINLDLMDSYLALSFSLLILTISPRPGWYVWIVPFISIFLIKYSDKKIKNNTSITLIFWLLNILYIAYFVFFHTNKDMVDILLFNSPLDIKVDNLLFKDFFFTLLEVVLVAMMYRIYSEGVRSNKIYDKKDNFLVCISGDSGSGKTYFQDIFKKIVGSYGVFLEGDSEHKWERDNPNWKNITHLNPKANYLYSQNESLKKLKIGESIERRDYDHNTGKFTESNRVDPKDFIFISGLHSFYLPKTRSIANLTIFLDTPDDLKFSWKVKRDSMERNYPVERIKKKIEEREEDFKNFISIQKNYADIIFRYQAIEDKAVDSLVVELDSSIDIESFLESLKEYKEDIVWDFNEDLSKLIINIEGLKLAPSDAMKILTENIPNHDEMLDQDFNLGADIDALMSLFVLKSISYKMSDS